MKFKTDPTRPDDLRLYNAAVAVLKKFKNNTIRAKQFDMITMQGTAVCLGGWINMELIGDDGNPLDYLNVSHNVGVRASALFFPAQDWAYSANKTQGIAALTRFIAGYKAPWAGVEH